MTQLPNYRATIASRVKELRLLHHWNQRELASRLGLSQSRLSEIERGDGSFTAEQFLLLLQLFNVGVSHFVDEKPSRDAQLQNALARLGALHLRESDNVIPSERLEEVNDVVVEVLIDGSARLVTALAPVLVANADHISLRRIESDLVKLGLENRLGWLVENVEAAIQQELSTELTTKWRRLYQRASVQLAQFLDSVSRRWDADETVLEDVLDPSIRSRSTVAKTKASRSKISNRWNVISSIRPDDFALALRGLRVGD